MFLLFIPLKIFSLIPKEYYQTITTTSYFLARVLNVMVEFYQITRRVAQPFHGQDKNRKK